MIALIEILKAVLLGIVQGITEWLPVSSTGHMILVDEFIHLNFSADFINMFLVVVQLGSIFAVVVLYFNRLNPFAWQRTMEQQAQQQAYYSCGKAIVIKKDTFLLWLRVLVAIIPVGIVGFLFEDIIRELFYNPTVVAIALIVYGVLFIVLENRHLSPRVNSIEEMSYKTALLIGTFQVLSLVPGTSRSGSTILGAIIVGTNRSVAAEFSFFLAVPVMFGASALELLKFGFALSALEWAVLLTGMLVAFLVSVWAIKFLMNYIKTNNFKAFGYYRIILGVVVILYFWLF